jgi:hypothetical protein
MTVVNIVLKYKKGEPIKLETYAVEKDKLIMDSQAIEIKAETEALESSTNHQDS